MAQNTDLAEILKSRVNVSLIGDNALLLRKLQAELQAKHRPMNISLADTVAMALAKLDADINK